MAATVPTTRPVAMVHSRLSGRGTQATAATVAPAVPAAASRRKKLSQPSAGRAASQKRTIRRTSMAEIIAQGVTEVWGHRQPWRAVRMAPCESPPRDRLRWTQR